MNQSRNDDGVVDDSTPEQSAIVADGGRKRKQLDPIASELCQQLYDSILNIKKEDGAMLCDTFICAPKRRQEPSYYEVVDNPINLLKVQQKLKTDSYDDIEELSSDLELLVKNAKAFYKPDTSEYQDACSLWQFVMTNKSKILESAGVEEEPRTKRVGRLPRRSLANESEISESSKVDKESNPYEELFAVVVNAIDPSDNRVLHKEFQLLPSKKMYPDYYDVIDHPIDLRLIATKIQTNAYSNIIEMEKDLLQMTKNACLFNEPVSQIYKDAKTLKKVFTKKRIEIESGKAKPTLSKRKEQSFSASICSLKKLKEELDSSDDDGENKKGKGPLWQLFDHLFNAASASDHRTGAPLRQSLWKLPYKRFHPEYYELIEKPLSMAQIQTKLKKGEYGNISDLTADLYLMLDNAKKAYPANNRMHKDAVKMLKIMNAKLGDDGLDVDVTDSDEDDDVLPLPRKKGRPRGTPVSLLSPSLQTPKLRPPLKAALKKKKLLTLQKQLIDHTTPYGRRLSKLFMKKPLKKLYPNYYDVIQHPIDLTTIEKNIKNGRYSSIEDLVFDYRLMFSNCRQYNEEHSVIYEDADLLEKALNDKIKDIPFADDFKKTPKVVKRTIKVTPLIIQLTKFYDTIKDYHEPKGNRQLSSVFMKLPSKSDYRDYYDIIKNPIDMEKIATKLRQQQYESIDDLSSDLLLMLENACKYNEPDSQIYKDALVLQQMAMQMKQALKESDETIPDVPLAVHEILLSLFTSLYNHQDDEGRCFSDSLSELPEYDEEQMGQKVRGISLDLIKRRLDKGVYKRLDIFQEDVFSCLERARTLSRTDSQIFEDSVELQEFFICKRDELCKNTLASPALEYTILRMNSAVESVRQIKMSQEEQDQEEEDKSADTFGESMTIDQKVFCVGDFVIFHDPEKVTPGIAYIERLWTDNKNVEMMSGKIYLRPAETYHLTTRKFMEQEVFKTVHSMDIPLDKILGKCYVMWIKDYIKMKPEGFMDKDVYVCESNYRSRDKHFKKIKNWPIVRNDDKTRLIARETPIELKLVMSVFKERVEKHKGELAELQLQEALVEKEKPNIPCAGADLEYGTTYFEQYNTICSGVVKTGDFVYVVTLAGKQSIAQIHSMWETPGGKSYFQGPWLLAPSEVSPVAQKSCYRQELLLSTVHDISPIIAIVGRCSVQEYSDYTTCRPTEIAEIDAYICEQLFDELTKCIRKFSPANSMKKFSHSKFVTQDEIFKFKRPIKPVKANSYVDPVLEQDMLIPSDVIMDFKAEPSSLAVLEDSMDNGPPYVGYETGATNSPAAPTPVTTKSKTKEKKKHVSGFLVYSREARKRIKEGNPDLPFGEISRIVGNDWKNLPSTVRQAWDDKASKIRDACRLQIFECSWDKCNYTFEDPIPWIEHCIDKDIGHVQTTFNSDEPEYYCLWKKCARLKKSCPPFPNLRRLVKHVREVHLSKGGRHIYTTEPVKTKSKTKPKTKYVNGFLLYSCEVRERIRVGNPDSSFGEISRIVGNDWKNLPSDVRQAWEDKALKTRVACRIQVFECSWDKCNYKFEDPFDCIQHCIDNDIGHVQTTFNSDEPEYNCLWKTCGRLRNSLPPFSNLRRLIRHVREAHLSKGGRYIHTNEKTKNFVPRKYGKTPTLANSFVDPVLEQDMLIPSDVIMDFKAEPSRLAVLENSMDDGPPSVGSDTRASNSPAASTSIMLIPSDVIMDFKAEPSSLAVLEDSMDNGPPSVDSGPGASNSPAASTPAKTKSKTKPKTKYVNGFVLYSCEVRKRIQDGNPDSSFGEISRIVGNDWKNLPSDVRQAWEDKALKIRVPYRLEVFECSWDKCNYKFEDPLDCIKHCIDNDIGHVQTTFNSDEPKYNCLWKKCERLKKSRPPFPNLRRLVKHVREVHLSKGGRHIYTTEIVATNSTAVTTKSETKPKPKYVNGFILYSCEVRKRIQDSNQGSSFAEISRIVGNDWKNLPSTLRQAWEDKASKIRVGRHITEKTKNVIPRKDGITSTLPSPAPMQTCVKMGMNSGCVQFDMSA